MTVKDKFKWEIEMFYYNYCGEKISMGIIGKFDSKNNADICAEALNKSLENREERIEYIYCVIER